MVRAGCVATSAARRDALPASCADGVARRRAGTSTRGDRGACARALEHRVRRRRSTCDAIAEARIDGDRSAGTPHADRPRSAHGRTIRIRSSPARAGRSSRRALSRRAAGRLVVARRARVARRRRSSLQFFRDPPRDDPAGSRTPCCRPADGRVVKVEQARDPYLDRDALKISVFMNVFNVHSQPQPGRRHGGRTSGTTPAASSTPRSTRRRSRTSATRCTCARARGQDVTCVQIAGLIARRILCYVEAGRHAGARPALRLHPLRLARRRLPRPGARRRRSPSATRCRATETILAELPA